MKQLKKIRNAAGGFVLHKHTNNNNGINIKWLSIEKWIDNSQAIMIFKTIYDENFPNRLKPTQKVASNSNLQSKKRDYNWC